MHGFLNILKPPGMSSHDVVAAVRKILGEKRCGHGGTLDPAAAGVLPVAVGQGTKYLEFANIGRKSYRGELLFGFSTDTGDDTGRVNSTLEGFIMPSEGEIRRVLKRFTGEISQVPPLYSAIKIAGQRAYDLARQDRTVNIPARLVEIFRLEILALRERRLLLAVDCSKGTYIRSLCADLGEALNIPAVMGFLLRTVAGAFRLEDSITLEELARLKETALIPPDKALAHIPSYDLPRQRAKAFANGLSTRVRTSTLPFLVRVYTAGEFIGLGRYDQESGELRPHKVYLT